MNKKSNKKNQINNQLKNQLKWNLSSFKANLNKDLYLYDLEIYKSLLFKVSTLLIITSLFSCSPENFNSSGSNQSGNSNLHNQFELSNESGIFGGTLSTDKFQKQNGIVQLELDMGLSGKATCTGTLIEKNIVLTAAHCVADPSIIQIKAIFGLSDKRNNKNIIVPAVKAVAHPNFNPEVATDQTGWSDIALLKLKTNAPATVSVVKLPSVVKLNLVKPGTQLILSGYGITNAVVRMQTINSQGQTIIVDLPSKGSGTLRQVSNIQVINLNANLSEIILDQTQSKGACHGDSGGPAFLANPDGTLTQVGLTSRGTDELGNCNKNAIYTNVAFHSNWIQTNVEQLKLVNRTIASQ